MLTPNQRRALAALLTCKSRTDAARLCGLSVKTLQVYEAQPEFAEALECGRRELLDYGLKFAELVDVNRRLDRLEEQLQ